MKGMLAAGQPPATPTESRALAQQDVVKRGNLWWSVANNKSNKKVGNGLLAMSSAAVLAVYSAGYVRTKTAANRVAYERAFASEAPPAKAARDVSYSAPSVPVAPSAPALPIHSEPKQKPVVASSSTLSKATATSNPGTSVSRVEAPSAPAEASGQVPAATVASASSAIPAATTATATAVQTQSDATVAAASTAPAAPTPPPVPVWKDGKYTAWGTCRHGDIQATVVIEAGRIISADITDCQTRYSCDIIEALPPKVISRQKNKFDAIGGATESAYAYYGAVYWALDQASK